MNNFIKNLKVKAKLNLLSALALTGIAIVGLVSVFAMAQLNDGANTIGQDALPGVDISRTLAKHLADIRLYQVRYVMSETTERMNYYTDLTDKSLSSFASSYAEYGSYVDASNANESALYKELASDFNTFKSLDANIRSLATSNKQREAVDLLDEDSLELWQEMTQDLEELVEINEQVADELVLSTDYLYWNMLIIIIIAAIIVFTVCIFVGIIIIKNLVIPINQADKCCQSTC